MVCMCKENDCHHAHGCYNTNQGMLCLTFYMSHYSFSGLIELKLNSTDILLICYHYFFFLERNGLYTVDILRKIILGNNDKRTKKKTHVNQSTSAATDVGNFRDLII